MRANEAMLPVFGYGSLLNGLTLPPSAQLRRATLPGWVRQWRSPQNVPSGRVCALTIERRPNSSLQGARFSTDTAVDANLAVREKTYVAIKERVETDGRLEKALIYIAPPGDLAWATTDCPICLSYVDCVLQGYYRMYGIEGVLAFVDTTEGWHLPFLNDRKQPRYPRTISLEACEQILFDKLLRERGADF